MMILCLLSRGLLY